MPTKNHVIVILVYENNHICRPAKMKFSKTEDFPRSKTEDPQTDAYSVARRAIGTQYLYILHKTLTKFIL